MRTWTIGMATVGVAGLVGLGVVLWMGPLDGAPPELTVAAPQGPVSGEVPFEVRAVDPQGVSLTVSVDGGAARDVPLAGWRVDTSRLDDGLHTVVVTATDRSWRRNTTSTEVVLRVDNTPPVIGVTATRAAQGKTAAFFVAIDEDAEITATLGGRPHPVHEVGERRWRGLMGFSVQQPPGRARVEITATDAAGNATVHMLPVDVHPTSFEQGGVIRLTPSQTSARRDTSGIDEMMAARDAAQTTEVPDQLWDGPMQLPVNGRRTSSFGKYRTYSDGLKSHHTGVDIANVVGTPVRSPADGVVLLAGPQLIYGNVVVVGHGHGVATDYNHLDSVDVAVGDRVRAGDVLGRLGNTGQSTGPHLHWGMTVHGIPVDAEQWLRQSFELSPEVEAALTDGTASIQVGAPGDR